ncbi:hypothetical protein K437DRAFT_162058 [Tilletiaria anomala UBC 951]|uniref:Uncharacterized protein n=1 Tax=Tilletiaria anomala (strain ATCC 24038 / CBS 436.72 / UBC 951) TaxID=1037660 RepID=A0A066WNX4_TILAU|nr:uncharacterized protein K437DRAFT_162058 [Tilletiaria anomala UBC 951]KDN52704.1 hypothetical protein K437DRAFT_162058 [Tilletiaria anomala UBC 951]
MIREEECWRAVAPRLGAASLGRGHYVSGGRIVFRCVESTGGEGRADCASTDVRAGTLNGDKVRCAVRVSERVDVHVPGRLEGQRARARHEGRRRRQPRGSQRRGRCRRGHAQGGAAMQPLLVLLNNAADTAAWHRSAALCICLGRCCRHAALVLASATSVATASGGGDVRRVHIVADSLSFIDLDLWEVLGRAHRGDAMVGRAVVAQEGAGGAGETCAERERVGHQDARSGRHAGARRVGFRGWVEGVSVRRAGATMGGWDTALALMDVLRGRRCGRAGRGGWGGFPPMLHHLLLNTVMYCAACFIHGKAPFIKSASPKLTYGQRCNGAHRLGGVSARRARGRRASGPRIRHNQGAGRPAPGVSGAQHSTTQQHTSKFAHSIKSQSRHAMEIGRWIDRLRVTTAEQYERGIVHIHTMH